MTHSSRAALTRSCRGLESRERRAISLVELLIVIAIMGMVIQLILPAVAASREAARRSQCVNQIRQLVLASHNYAAAHRVLPAGAVERGGDPNVNDNGWHRKDPNDFSTNFTWATLLLPYMEHQDIYEMYDFRQPALTEVNALARAQIVPQYTCPSDLLQINEPRPGQPGGGESGVGSWKILSRMRLNYAANYGNTGYAQVDMGDVKFLGGAFTNGVWYPFAKISDGTSCTLAFAEVLPLHGATYLGPPGDGMIAEGGQAFEGLLGPNSDEPDVVCNMCESNRIIHVGCVVDINDNAQTMAARSPHPGGVNAALVDGSVRFFADTIDLETWRALTSSRGAEVVEFP